MDFLRTIGLDATLVGAASQTTQQAIDIGAMLSSDVTLETTFPDTSLGNQLKQVAKVIGFMGEEFTQETTYDGYKDFDGIKKATKIDSKRDGEKFVSYESTDFQVLKNVDAATFKEPD